MIVQERLHRNCSYGSIRFNHQCSCRIQAIGQRCYQPVVELPRVALERLAVRQWFGTFPEETRRHRLQFFPVYFDAPALDPAIVE